MEKLVAVQRDPRFDLIVLDTPPTANALDFLDAPERLVEALDSADDALVRRRRSSRPARLSFNLLARSAAVVLRGLGRITGGGFLEAMAEFITELNDLFGGFKQRARDGRGGAPEPGGVVRARHEPGADEHPGGRSSSASASSERAHAARRVRREPLPPPAALRRARPRRWPTRPLPSQRGASTLDEDARRAPRASPRATPCARAPRRDARTRARRAMRRQVPVVRVPELASDVHDLRTLGDVAERPHARRSV